MRPPFQGPKSVSAQKPDWADEYYNNKFREIGRREPDRRRVITVTPAAAEKIRGSAPGNGTWFFRARVEVVSREGGVPTAFRNRIDVVTEVFPEYDLLDDSQGIPVVVDRRSAEFLDGFTVDWVVSDDGNSGFRIGNTDR